MRIWVRSGVKVRFLSNAARIFKCCVGEPRTRQEPPRSSGPRPSLRVTRGSQGPRPLNQKRKLFPGPRPAYPGRQRLAARPRLQGRATPHVQVLESLPDSLSPSSGPRFSNDLISWPCRCKRSFRFRLRIDSPMCNCCSHGTLLHVSPQGSHLSICYYHQDLRRGRLQAGSRPVPFSAHPLAPLLTAA
jgi:hypothetical protein